MTDPAIDPHPESATGGLLSLPMSLDAPALARLHVRRYAPHLSPAALDDALIATSELVTNAVLYGAPEITLEVLLQPVFLTVQVGDAGPQLPPEHPVAPGPNALGGRGLSIVEAIASTWGISRRSLRPGKDVWFSLRR
jgi:anti-sigma regulatory factor (Ser/Thr protein kinase)